VVFDVSSGLGKRHAGFARRELSGLFEKTVALFQASAFGDESRQVDDASGIARRELHGAA
jgi:hypothetical protein